MEKCDLLIKNAIVMTDYETVEYGMDIAVSDGRITAVAKSGAREFCAEKTISGEEKLFMPGLIDSHMHTGQQLLKGLVLDAKPIIWTRVMLPFESTLTPEKMKLSAQAAALEMIKSGTTAFIDAGSYYMDAALINYIKEKYPSVKCAVATCWEEGPKAYHTCNNSWYTFMDGGPWAPWIPSKVNTHAPAANEAEDSGIVAIPHLSRDLMACYDGNGSNFGTHPQNVLRGMLYTPGQFNPDGSYSGQSYPYLYNLIDQYRYQARFNNGYAYNMQFVGPGWMNKMGRWEAPYELLKASYDDGCAYYGQLKKEGKLVDMTMSEFADYYRGKKRYTEPECALWRDIIYGSDKQLFWYCDPYMRACVNMDQGGAIVDLRPYAAKLEWEIGIGTKHVQECGYPYLIQEKYRAGYFTHYAGEGTVRSAKLCRNGEEVDLCLCRTHAHFSQEGTCRKLTLDPVEVVFSDVTVKVQTVLTFQEGTGDIKIERTILETTDPSAEVAINEYMVACYGTTEYPEDMTSLTLSARKGDEEHPMAYAYKCREFALEGAEEVSCVLPPIKTRVSLECRGRDKEGYYKEGYAFSPMFTLGYTGTLKEKEVFTTWLKLARAD